MKFANLFLVLLSCVMLSFADVGPEFDEQNLLPNGKNVCSYVESRPINVNVSTTVHTFVTALKKIKSGWWGEEVFKTVYRRKSKVVYHMVTKWRNVDVPYCCSGWTSLKGSKHCSIPICGISCMNGGICVGPDKCDCAPGFEGQYCHNDVNECLNKSLNKCEQICENTHGSFHCRCKDGFVTKANNKNGCQDIDECTKNVCRCPTGDKNCIATCVNLPGSYKCSCNAGYKAGFDGMCRDRNECLDDVCEHRCINTPGSYQCSCFLGFELNVTTGNCYDIDECKIDNGGCNQICHNVYGGSVCRCNSGYYLDDDSHTCRQLGETIKSLEVCNVKASYKMISCNWPQKIQTLYAFYGRVSNDFCEPKNVTVGDSCIIEGVTKYMSQLCNGKTACFIDAPTSVNGLKDSCPNMDKYFQVFYKCV